MGTVALDRLVGFVLLAGVFLMVAGVFAWAAWEKFTAWRRAQHGQPPRECRPGCPVCEVQRLEWAAQERRARRTRRGVR